MEDFQDIPWVNTEAERKVSMVLWAKYPDFMAYTLPARIIDKIKR